tara:strand:- start:5 stop:445 length:441 start_codon:yes stop_codon:yes gene_type:complete
VRFIRVLLTFFIISSFSSYAHSSGGIGPIKFSEIDFEIFMAYMRGDGRSTGEVGKKRGTPGNFVINKESTWSRYTYCPIKYGGNCRTDHGKLIQKCSKESKKKGYGRCYLFAKYGKIVWDGKNIRLPRKFDQAYIESVFKENGWLD